MASLANVTPGSSFPGLIKTSDNCALTSCVQLTDGCGNAIPIIISPTTSSINFGTIVNDVSGCGSMILGGTGSKAIGAYSILSGSGSCITSNDSVVLGGYSNKALGYNSTIFGARNTICDCGVQYHSTIAGGADNLIEGHLAFIGGGIANLILGGTGSSCNAIVGGEQNCIVSRYSTPNGTNIIGGGRYNRILPDNTLCVNSVHSIIAGGCCNSICGYNYGTIPGGAYNCITNGSALGRQEGGVISGGVFNLVTVNHGSIMGSFASQVSGGYSTVIGGACNLASGCCSAVVSGQCNTVSASFSSVLGGSNNNACLTYSGIFGCGITARMDCAFHANRLVLTNLPTSSAGLPSGAVWNDAGTLKIVA